MVYLYASLGVMMLTGIMAMFEMAMSFNAQQIQFRPPQDSYSGSTSQQADRDLLRLLNQDDLLVSLGSNGVPWTGSDLCDQLRCRFNPVAQSDCEGTNAFDKDLFDLSPLKQYQRSADTTSNADELRGACALASGAHRVLVVPNPSTDPAVLEQEPYRLYSCQTGGQQTECLFETQD